MVRSFMEADSKG